MRRVLLALFAVALIIGCIKPSSESTDNNDASTKKGKTSAEDDAVVEPIADGGSPYLPDADAGSSLWDPQHDYLLEVGTLGPKHSPCSAGEFSVFYQPSFDRISTLVCEKVDDSWIVVDHERATTHEEKADVLVVLSTSKVVTRGRCDDTQPDVVLSMSGSDAGTRSYGANEGKCGIPGVSLYIHNMDAVVATFRMFAL